MGRCFFNFSTKQRLRPRVKLLEMHCGRPRDCKWLRVTPGTEPVDQTWLRRDGQILVFKDSTIQR